MAVQQNLAVPLGEPWLPSWVAPAARVPPVDGSLCTCQKFCAYFTTPGGIKPCLLCMCPRYFYDRPYQWKIEETGPSVVTFEFLPWEILKKKIRVSFTEEGMSFGFHYGSDTQDGSRMKMYRVKRPSGLITWAGCGADGVEIKYLAPPAIDFLEKDLRYIIPYTGAVQDFFEHVWPN